MNKNLMLSLVSTAVMFALSGCGGGGGNDDPETPVNQAPTAISLSANSVNENDTGATIGTLTATDPNAADTFTFTTSHENYEISGNTLKLKDGVALNFEKVASETVSVTVTDNGGLSHTQDLTINVSDVLDTYHFLDATGNSTVSYSGQTTRLVLISELNQYIANELQAELESGVLESRQAVIDKLNSFYQISDEDYDLIADVFAIDHMANVQQLTLRELSSSKKDLYGKIAGNDATGQHRNWNDGEFIGWGEAGSVTPHELVQVFFGLLGDHAQTWIDGSTRTDFNGNEINKIYLTENGQDLKQLIQKFLLGAVAYSQGVDDYFDNDIDGKGLNVSNISTGSVYTPLEHHWDEGFGYFGAARDYLEYTDDEIAGKGGREEYATGSHDSNGDGLFDLKSEVNMGNSTNAAKRDRGTVASSNPTDYTSAAFNALLNGRKIINDNIGNELSDAQMAELLIERDKIVENWEKSISATVVHYINDTVADLNRIGTDDFSYSDLAKHWSELKGFALNLQFNRLSPLSIEAYTQLHSLLRDSPQLSSQESIEQYIEDLMSARDLLQNAYQFDAEHVENW